MHGHQGCHIPTEGASPLYLLDIPIPDCTHVYIPLEARKSPYRALLFSSTPVTNANPSFCEARFSALPTVITCGPVVGFQPFLDNGITSDVSSPSLQVVTR